MLMLLFYGLLYKYDIVDCVFSLDGHTSISCGEVSKSVSLTSVNGQEKVHVRGTVATEDSSCLNMLSTAAVLTPCPPHFTYPTLQPSTSETNVTNPFLSLSLMYDGQGLDRVRCAGLVSEGMSFIKMPPSLRDLSVVGCMRVTDAAGSSTTAPQKPFADSTRSDDSDGSVEKWRNADGRLLPDPDLASSALHAGADGRGIVRA